MLLLPGFAFFLLPLAIGGIVLWAVVKQKERQTTAWKRAAGELGLDLDPGTLTRRASMTGTIGRTPVTVSVVRVGSGKDSTVYTQYRVAYPPLGIGLRLAREAGWKKLVRVFGVAEQEIGDEPFDTAFEIRATTASAAASFLTLGKRQALLRLIAAYPNAVVEDDGIQLRTRSVETDPAVIVSTTRRLAEVAAVVIDGRALDTLDRQLTERIRGDFAARPEPLVHPHPDDLHTAIAQVERLYGAKRIEDAAAVLAPIEQRLPADPDVVGWKAKVATPPRAAPAPPPAADVVAIATELFGSSRLSFETTQLFEERFAGTPVSWQGTVRRAHDVRGDHDFDGATITKTIVHVATIENDLYGNAEVDAVVAFPPGTRLERGERVSFTGTLVGVDGLIRNLFVADGKLA